MGLSDVIGMFVGIDNHRICQALALLSQAVTGLKRVSTGSFVACGGALGNPQHAHTVDKLRVVLVETTSNFRVYVLGECFERLGFFAAGLDCVN